MSCKIGRERREYIVVYLPFQNSHFNRLVLDFCCTSHLFAPFNFLIQTSVNRSRFCCTSHFLTEVLSQIGQACLTWFVYPITLSNYLLFVPLLAAFEVYLFSRHLSPTRHILNPDRSSGCAATACRIL
jgi:hypothetical protein